MSPHDYSIALRIRHPSIDPADITRQLGIVPQHAWRAGEPRSVEADEVGSAVHRETYWVGLVPQGPQQHPTLGSDLGPPASLIIAALKSHATQRQVLALYFTLLKMKRAAGFWGEFAEQGGTVECLLQVHNTERFQLDLSQPVLLALAELKVPLSIEVDDGLRAAA
jgi:hypothetical protein